MAGLFTLCFGEGTREAHCEGSSNGRLAGGKQGRDVLKIEF